MAERDIEKSPDSTILDEWYEVRWPRLLANMRHSLAKRNKFGPYVPYVYLSPEEAAKWRKAVRDG